MSEQQEFRHELEATLAARQEIGAELEPQLVDRFADRMEQEIDRRAREVASKRRPNNTTWGPEHMLGSLGIGIPLVAIAGGIADLPGVIAIAIAIVLVNLIGVLRR